MTEPGPATAGAPAFFAGTEHQPFVFRATDNAPGRGGALLIHGFMGTPAEMRPLGRRLAGGGLTAHGLLLPGFGPDLPNLVRTGRDAWLASAQRVWDEIHYRHHPAGIVGFSLGASVALHLAAQTRPDFLVLLAPFWAIDDWRVNALPLLKHVIPTFNPFAEVDLDDPQVRADLGRMMPDIDLDDPEVRATLRSDVELSTAIIDDVRHLGQTAYRLAPQIDVPVLVVQGSDDETVRPRQTRQLLTRLGGPVTYHEIPAGHQFPKQTNGTGPDFARLVLDFLQDRIR